MGSSVRCVLDNIENYVSVNVHEDQFFLRNKKIENTPIDSALKKEYARDFMLFKFCNLNATSKLVRFYIRIVGVVVIAFGL